MRLINDNSKINLLDEWRRPASMTSPLGQNGYVEIQQAGWRGVQSHAAAHGRPRVSANSFDQGQGQRRKCVHIGSPS
jgi:hypothetical protein